MVRRPIDVYVVVFASADRSEMGGGSCAFLTEAEAVECIRAEIKSSLDGSWDEADFDSEELSDAAYEKAVKEIDSMDYAQLKTAYEEDTGDDWIQTVFIDKHTLAPLPDLSDPEKIEDFLGATNVG